RPAPFQFGIWEFPQMGVDHAGRTPANEEATRFLHDEGRKSALSWGGLCSQAGYFIGPVLAPGDAVFSNRTKRALRLARGASDRAQFHQSLIEVRTISRTRFLSPRRGEDQVFREPPESGVGFRPARI